MSTEISTVKKKSNKRISILTIGGWFVILVLLMFGVLSIAFGRVGIFVKDSNQKVVLRNVVCNDEVIGRYNTMLQTETMAAYDSGIKSLATDIEALSGYGKDPNCLFILVNYYLRKEDATKARQYVNELKTQSDSGNYLSGKIESPDSIQGIEDSVNFLEKNGTTVNAVDAG